MKKDRVTKRCLFAFIRRYLLISLSAILPAAGIAQQPAAILSIFRIYSSHTSFPDTGRSNGHLYNKVLYDAPTHYMDSSVLIIVPKMAAIGKKVNLICWFHGWNNNIDSAVVRYQLAAQFAAARLNAVLVLAETAKDAPDSYGGRLENPGVFKELVADVLEKLKEEKICKKRSKPGNILLAGHSGAYRVMANILKNGGLPVKETILFDALYADTEKFMNWIKESPRHRFIDIYTDHGGTDEETRNMMTSLAKEPLAYATVEETSLTRALLKNDRLLFIHSPRAHNDIINNPDNFLLFLQNSPVFSHH
ncbi:MAG: hypothetical protein P4L51_28760 [Puia sp.]|nr:hypothetical protein [Puia sp.]